MVILKFGGSSVGTTERIKQVMQIVQQSKKKHREIAVVFSAFQGVTDSLQEIAKMAATGTPRYLDMLFSLEERHQKAIDELISAKQRKETLLFFHDTMRELREVVHGVFLLKELTARSMDFVFSFGERLSSKIIADALLSVGFECEYVDARLLVKTDTVFNNASVMYDLTDKNIRAYFKKSKSTKIITGFIGSTLKNETTTIGRGGSDLTASLFGAALNVKEIEIWTDVNGVLTADPRKVSNAFSLETMSYEEAMEMAHFGAKVIYPPTMQPALLKNIPLRIKNTFEPTHPGTLISSKKSTDDYQVKGITSIDDTSLIRINGAGLFGGVGFTARIFEALANKGISAFLIVQGSSQYSLCMAVPPKQASAAVKAISDELRYEMKEGKISSVFSEGSLSVIALVGDQMSKRPGTAGKVFSSLGENGINIIAIAQGPSERNISLVVDKKDEPKALRVLHKGMFKSDVSEVNIYLAGAGLVGSSLIDLIAERGETIKSRKGLDLRIVGIANSRKMAFEYMGMNTSSWKKELNDSDAKQDPALFVHSVLKDDRKEKVFVDCTAGNTFIPFYEKILASGIPVITPNKKANAGNIKFYKKLRDAATSGNSGFYYATNVGAALPVISTVQHLIDSGDEIVKIEGILSGTLGYLFAAFDGTLPFSKLVVKAKEQGFTEPDPRDDLNGLDAARKLLILARESKYDIELKDVKVENLVPAKLRNLKSVDDFLQQMSNYDAVFDKRLAEAQKEGKVLRYIAKMEKGKCSASLTAVGPEHPLYRFEPGNSVIAFTTRIYTERPLVVSGPGAGGVVTASGVLADIIKAGKTLE